MIQNPIVPPPPSPTSAPANNGTVDVKLTVCLTSELNTILLPWAGHMKVLSPAPLRDRMRQFGEALIRGHS